MKKLSFLLAMMLVFFLCACDSTVEKSAVSSGTPEDSTPTQSENAPSESEDRPTEPNEDPSEPTSTPSEPDPTEPTITPSEPENQDKGDTTPDSSGVKENEQNPAPDPIPPDDVVPGTTSHNAILDGIAALSKNVNGLETANKNEDINGILKSDEIKTYIQDYAVYSLTDGTIFGYLYYENAEDTNAASDFANQQIDDIAKDMGKNSYVNANAQKHYAFFIIADDTTPFIAFYMQCKEGNLPN